VSGAIRNDSSPIRYPTSMLNPLKPSGQVSVPVVLRGGAYDVARRDALKAELAQVEPYTDIVIDLSTTELLDCSCIGVLAAKLRAWKDRRPQTTLRLRNVSTNIARVLRLLKLDEVFIVENLRSDANVIP